MDHREDERTVDYSSRSALRKTREAMLGEKSKN